MTVKLLIVYFLTINLIGVIVNIADKRKAQKNRWRIKESTLWLIGLLGGAAGSYVIMKIIRHKTKHTGFMIGMPVLAVLQIAALIVAILKLTGSF